MNLSNLLSCVEDEPVPVLREVPLHPDIRFPATHAFLFRDSHRRFLDFSHSLANYSIQYVYFAYILHKKECGNLYTNARDWIKLTLSGQGFLNYSLRCNFGAHLWDCGDMSQFSQAMGGIWRCIILYLWPHLKLWRYVAILLGYG